MYSLEVMIHSFLTMVAKSIIIVLKWYGATRTTLQCSDYNVQIYVSSKLQ